MALEEWWTRLGKDPFYVSPTIEIHDDPKFDTDETFRVCLMTEDSNMYQYSLRRVHGDCLSLVKWYYRSKDPKILRIFQMNSVPKDNQFFFCVTENREFRFDDWMQCYNPISWKDKSYNMGRFLYPLRSLIQSTLLVLGMQNGSQEKTTIDFEIDPSLVFVVGRPKGRFYIVVGFVKIQKRNGNGGLLCLKGVAEIISKWFNIHRVVEKKIPHEMRALMKVLRNWNGNKVGNKVGETESSALEMLTRHPVFYQKDYKAWFDFIIKLKPLYLDLVDPAKCGFELVDAFVELGYTAVDRNTKWYDESKAIQSIKDFKNNSERHFGIFNTIGGMIVDIRNLAAHFPRSTDKGVQWMHAYKNIEKMLEGTACAIHLCCIRSGLANRFEEV